MRYERVKVMRDTQTVNNRAVPPWEIPVLEFIFDAGNIEPLGVFEEVDQDYPDPAAEYDRLTAKYRKDWETKTDFVALVYGNARAGVRALGKAIDEAREADEAVVRGARKRRPLTHRAREAFASDPLLA